MNPVVRSMVTLLTLVLVAWVAWLALLLASKERILYPGATGIEAPVPLRAPDDVTVLRHPVDDGHVHGWLLPPIGEPLAPPAMVVHFHGNGERIELWAHGMRPWREAGYWLLLPEYRGFGGAAGRPSERGIVDDATHLLRAALQESDVPEDRLLFHGRSLGTGVAAQLGRHVPPRAYVLESGFSRIVDLTRRLLVPDPLVRDRYDTLGTLRGTDRPVLLLHGEHDEVIPFHHALRLRDGIPTATLLPLDCGHNDCPPDHDAYWAALFAFAEPLFGDVRGPQAPADAREDDSTGR
ncbi:MAG: hypothetical protein EA398_03865 [Deltaproteobacteria bacterium]|nr:MAG: hypothetical protein EA398_03865 [Deltaproteobacteria bacterium]